MLIGFSFAKTILGTLQLRYTGLQQYLDTLLGLHGIWARIFPTFIWILLSIIFIFVLSKTRFGLNVFAVGGGPKAAYLAGVRSETVRIIAYVVSGVTAAIGAIILAYRIGFLMPNSSEAFLIESIAAVILGGTNINGGEGSIFGSFFGAIVIAALLNILNLLRVDPFIQYAIMGLLLLIITFNISYLSTRK
jgi:ribose transport system permease protein